MAQEVTNFARFYALFNKLPYQGDREEFKKQIVLQYTWNRTDSLKEMTAKEYEVFCTALEKLMAQGYDPVNPFRNGLPDEAHWRAHMRADIALLLACDYIYMLKDWELSKGAKLELDVASSCGIKVLFE